MILKDTLEKVKARWVDYCRKLQTRKDIETKMVKETEGKNGLKARNRRKMKLS
jgi:hypothetical protein